MNRKQILVAIRRHCESEYAKITHWPHDIHHIQCVVRNARRICKLEGLPTKDAFLVELAAWLHDLGRVEEESGYQFEQSNHAEISYRLSKKILKPFERKLGRDSVYNLLQAVREHNLADPPHAANRILRLLQDADRGAGIRIAGVYTFLNYMKLIETEPIYTNVDARRQLDKVVAQLVEKHQVSRAIEVLGWALDWYHGNAHQNGSGKRVVPLYSQAARTLYRSGLREIEQFIERLTEIQANRASNQETPDQPPGESI